MSTSGIVCDKVAIMPHCFTYLKCCSIILIGRLSKNARKKCHVCHVLKPVYLLHKTRMWIRIFLSDPNQRIRHPELRIRTREPNGFGSYLNIFVAILKICFQTVTNHKIIYIKNYGYLLNYFSEILLNV
jgi:hypothetical protein